MVHHALTTIAAGSACGLTIPAPACTSPVVVTPGVTIADVYGRPALCSTSWPGIIENEGSVLVPGHAAAVPFVRDTVINRAFRLALTCACWDVPEAPATASRAWSPPPRTAP